MEELHMANAKKCDRCGTYHDWSINHITLEDGRLFADYDTDVHYDLCKECRNEFEDFMNGVKPATLREKLFARIRTNKE
jgi:hypothetical protein